QPDVANTSVIARDHATRRWRTEVVVTVGVRIRQKCADVHHRLGEHRWSGHPRVDDGFWDGDDDRGGFKPRVNWIDTLHHEYLNHSVHGAIGGVHLDVPHQTVDALPRSGNRNGHVVSPLT